MTGLIPTGVGNTKSAGVRDLRKRAHPHGCGEHIISDAKNASQGGSSPRVWGTLTFDDAVYESIRLIPTGVGNTSPPFLLLLLRWAHPHGCGEHRPADEVIHIWGGSSPRVWGTRECGY